MGRALYWSAQHDFFTAPNTTFRCSRWDPCSCLLWHPCLRHSTLDVVVQGVRPTVPPWLLLLNGATNHTTPHPGHIYSPIVSNGSILNVTSVGGSVLPGPFYLNDVLLAPDLVHSLLFVRWFTTDNSCSMEFDPFGLTVKDLVTRRVLTRYDNTGLLYTLPLPTSTTPTLRTVPYALAATASSVTWHRHLGHSDPDVLFKL
jgi:hypothetical protein